MMCVLALTIPGIALAHVGDGVEVGWLSWNVAPAVAVPLLLTGIWYGHGARRRRHHNPDEAILVGAGILTVAIALLSPVDPLGERSYTMHQVQHLLLRSIAPLLLFAISPLATFVIGAPHRVRILAGSLGSIRPLAWVFRILVHPVTVTALFVATPWVWQWPPYFTAALRDPITHDWMHFSMLGTGLLFWWRALDDRPSAPGHGQRIIMLSVATAANAVLGKMLTLKSDVLYPVYGELGRYWFSAEVDEVIGGLIVWIPGSQMSLIGIWLVIRQWGRREARVQERRERILRQCASPDSEADEDSVTGDLRRSTIRHQAVGLGALSISILLGFIVWIGWAIMSQC